MENTPNTPRPELTPADIAALMIWLHTRTERGDAT